MPQPTSSVTFSRREKARLRLASQGLTVPRWESAEEVVRAIVVDGQVRGTWNKQTIEDLGMPGYAIRKVQKLWRDAH
ncbi:hypothetical protein RAE08_07635 [Corynebacterium tuberculostearicum]|uniref:hypothetical protein n=1 Tax=Corynebacterium tuberculostearicum TaxID=38304 RepID=UPI002934A1F1|nr:hypothetical protein [Corynebacterium tuberculostearicum]MDV2431006.1 hypothetical protein [Corynebacterium tuberculostearicum]